MGVQTLQKISCDVYWYHFLFWNAKKLISISTSRFTRVRESGSWTRKIKWFGKMWHINANEKNRLYAPVRRSIFSVYLCQPNSRIPQGHGHSFMHELLITSSFQVLNLFALRLYFSHDRHVRVCYRWNRSNWIESYARTSKTSLHQCNIYCKIGIEKHIFLWNHYI